MKSLLFLFPLAAASLLHAQSLSTLGTAGGELNGGSYVLCYTVGETAVVRRSGLDEYVLQEGFWQPGINCLISDLADLAGVQIDIRVMPNPTDGYFTLDLGEGFPVELNSTLYDPLGRTVETATIAAGLTRPVMGNPGLKNGLYLLRLSTIAGHPVYSLRILKI